MRQRYDIVPVIPRVLPVKTKDRVFLRRVDSQINLDYRDVNASLFCTELKRCDDWHNDKKPGRVISTYV